MSLTIQYVKLYYHETGDSVFPVYLENTTYSGWYYVNDTGDRIYLGKDLSAKFDAMADSKKDIAVRIVYDGKMIELVKRDAIIGFHLFEVKKFYVVLKDCQ